MGDIALRGNKLTRGPHGHGPKPFLNKPGQAQGTHGGKAKGGRIGLQTGKTPEHYLVHGYGSTYKPKRKRKAIGGAIKKVVKTIVDKVGKGKGKGKGKGRPKAGPRAPSRPKKTWPPKYSDLLRRFPKMPQPHKSPGDRPYILKPKDTRGEPMVPAAKGGRMGFKKGGTDKKWMQKVSASIKKRGTKGKCTPITKPGCTGRAKALAKTFKKIAAKRKA